mmetsp:Transcript_43652/g.121332  ORF Transcript_43652/g.121332 Transcript_43652/m.121332 type:complete len:260 (+) Transcript_43652:330-1109(+)
MAFWPTTRIPSPVCRTASRSWPRHSLIMKPCTAVTDTRNMPIASIIETRMPPQPGWGMFHSTRVCVFNARRVEASVLSTAVQNVTVTNTDKHSSVWDFGLSSAYRTVFLRMLFSIQSAPLVMPRVTATALMIPNITEASQTSKPQTSTAVFCHRQVNPVWMNAQRLHATHVLRNIADDNTSSTCSQKFLSPPCATGATASSVSLDRKLSTYAVVDCGDSQTSRVSQPSGIDRGDRGGSKTLRSRPGPLHKGQQRPRARG